MKIDKTKLDSTQLDYLSQAEKLQAELIEQGFMASRIEKGENRCDFKVIFFDGVNDYEIRRDYQQNIHVNRVKWGNYSHVSSSERGDLYRKYNSNNMKVLSARKLQQKIDLENAYHNEMQEKENKAVEKQREFLESIKNLPFNYSREDYNDPKSEIKSGFCVQNGIEFSFELSQDGYISKKISIHYNVDNSIESFLKLSDNKYFN